MSKSFHISAFWRDDIVKHGGVRRSAQLGEYAARHGREVCCPPRSLVGLGRGLLKPLVCFRVLILIYRAGFSRFTLRGIVVAIRQGVWLLPILDQSPNEEIWIEIAPGRPMLLAMFLCCRGQNFVAYPHNVEFLVPRPPHPYFSGPEAEYIIERLIYKSARRTYAISHFDAAVIRSLGGFNVTTLSYTPVGIFKEQLQLIKSKRQRTRKSGGLIVGTTTNPPTREGIKEVLRLVGKDRLGVQFKLAGYGTEIFFDCAPACVEVLGSVTQEQMRDLMCRCEFLLIKQPQTSGMITRLVEAEIASIPVYILGDYIQADDPFLTLTRRISSLREIILQ